MVFGVEYFSYEFQCTWSEYEIAHGLDRPWMCHMPDIIGFIAVFIGIGNVKSSSHFLTSNSSHDVLLDIQLCALRQNTRRRQFYANIDRRGHYGEHAPVELYTVL